MAAAPEGATGSRVVTSIYFTKFSEDHWTEAEASPPAAVMFKDKEYPSATAALEAYIQKHEGRMRLGTILPEIRSQRPFVAVEDLLIPDTGSGSVHSASSQVGFAERVQTQRLLALRNMVDEAYMRLEAQASERARINETQHTLSSYQQEQSALINQTLIESQRVLTCISPLPEVKPMASSCTEGGSMCTDVLLQVQATQTAMASAETAQPRRGCKTIQDYVDEARRIVADPSPSAIAAPLTETLSRLKAGIPVMGPGTECSLHTQEAPQYDAHVSMGLVGSTARPTVFSVPPPQRRHHGDSKVDNGGRSPPSWVQALGSSTGHQPKQTIKQGGNYASGYSGHLINSDLGFSAGGENWNRSKDDMYLLFPGYGSHFNRSNNGLQHLSSVGRMASDTSITTDDLVYATPDGRSLSALKIKSSMPSPALLHPQGASFHGSGKPYSSNDGVATRLLSTMRQDFADRLIQEVDEGPSSIVTAHGLQPYESPIIPQHQNPRTQQLLRTPTSPISLAKQRTLGLLTPETERLLTHPPLPAPMPGYDPAPSPILSRSYSADRGSVDKSPDLMKSTLDSDAAPMDTVDLSADFTQRVRALLLAPPGSDMKKYSPGDESERTTDILDGDREWERQPPYKPPKYVSEKLAYGPRIDSSGEKRANIVDSFLKECLDESNKEAFLPHTLSGPDQPGSMEALKNMLFKVQKMVLPPVDQSMSETTETTSSSSSITLNGHDGNQQEFSAAPKTGSEKLDTQENETPVEAHLPTLAAYERLVENTSCFEEQHGSESLQRAMEHLGRLKTLVKNTK